MPTVPNFPGGVAMTHGIDIRTAHSAPSIYPGLTDCQICLMESLGLDGPGDITTLTSRVAGYLAMAGIPRTQWFTKKEVGHALSQLAERHLVGEFADGRWAR